jgi:hypothetical protein
VLAAIGMGLAPASLAVPPVFPADYPWNQQITNAPVAASSAAIMNAITSTYGNGPIHPDFGQDSHALNAALYGIPYNIVHGSTIPLVFVTLGTYAGQSDPQPAPIIPSAVLEGDYQSGPRPGGTAARGDSHLLVWDVDSNTAYEFYATSRPSENADNRWHAAQESVWHFNSDAFRMIQWTSADAAGLSILAGLVRPDEGLPVSQGGQGVIHHAIRMTLQNAVILDQFIYPASHMANPTNTNPAVQPPMGARFRLKASVDISALYPQSKIIAQAMKDYGLILADNGSNFYFTGASDSPNPAGGSPLTWDDNDIQDSTHGLKSLHYADFEVVDLTPRITGISPASANAGATIAITGQNFSGAAGHLSVLFGSTAATSLTIVSDTQLIVTTPAGSGTVDIRVQSGISDAGDTQNINSPIFGYGISATTTADRFTWSSGSGGVCCRGATCALTTTQAACTVPPGVVAGAQWFSGSACNAPGNARTPCCQADYNKSVGVTVQDIFDFINDWFAGSGYARPGSDGSAGTMSVQNIFDFINDWFAGCP